MLTNQPVHFMITKNIPSSFYLIVFIHLLVFRTHGQAGTSNDPFTSLGQAWFAPSSGIYHFKIGTTTFSSHVEAGNGWILIASGNSATDESSYSTTSALTLQSDAILPSSIYTSPLINAVRMNATSGPSIPFDVQSSNAAVLSNLRSNKTLSYNTNSNNWTGVGTDRLTRGCPGNNKSLNTHIYHACGTSTNMHWQVGQFTNHERVALADNVKSDLNLWVRTASVPLPIQLLHFNAYFHSNGSVVLDWQTASEIQNDYFTIERSMDGHSFEAVKNIDGAGTSSMVLNYSEIDKSPYLGLSYYRLKQTDFDGQFDYSEIRSVNSFSPTMRENLYIYPNIVTTKVTIEGEKSILEEISIYDPQGQKVTHLTKKNKVSENIVVFDLSQLNKGVYYIKTKTTNNKVFKQ